MQHFIVSPAWDDGSLWAALARISDRLVGGPDACLVIDDTALPERGTRSIGVARQYCGALGKTGVVIGYSPLTMNNIDKSGNNLGDMLRVNT